MRILMVGSEALPFAKTGGLADVLGALPRALVRLGHQVDVFMPRYRGIPGGDPVGMVSFWPGGLADTSVHAATIDGVRFLFVDRPELFDRPSLYGESSQDYPDNPSRFAGLSRAALDWSDTAPEPYDVLHAHDWQAALVPVLLATLPRRRVGPRPRTVFTIHNLAYQGMFDASWLSRLGFGSDLMRPEALEFWGRISFLKGGILFSDWITSVSPTYAREIQTPDLGFGFDGIMRNRASALVGILNGIDYDQWDPARDPHLPVGFSASNLEGKMLAKRQVLETYSLPTSETELRRPLVAMISRLVDQKGFDLLAALVDELPRLNASFVLLGTGERRYENLWTGLAARHPERIGARIGFDEGLAHLIEGGADLFVMPSRFEPCGLNQMYSLRYGTLPLVRATGGLSDTVRNLNPATDEGTGFVFDAYTPQALLGTLRWALDLFEDRALWHRAQTRGMRLDYSWEASAREYVKIYERTTH